jgi:hypothetical protein
MRGNGNCRLSNSGGNGGGSNGSTAAKMAQFGAQFFTKLRPKERCFSNTYRAIFVLPHDFGRNLSETSY